MTRNIPIGVFAAQNAIGGGGPGPGPGPGGSGVWFFDERFLDANHTVESDGATVTNATGSLNANAIHTAQTLAGNDTNIYYMEFDVTAGDGSMSGECGFVGVNFLPRAVVGRVGDGESMGVGRTLSAIRSNGSNVVTGLTSFGFPDTLMIAFQPSTGSIWTGVDGVWDNDPDVDAANYVYPGNPDFDDKRPEYWRVSINPTDPNRSVTLVYEAANFTYSVPSACVALEAAPFTQGLEVRAQKIVVITEG